MIVEDESTIVIKRIKKYSKGHHGGSWKVAFADFATAMMAFFLVLWLLQSSTPEQRKSISGYFKDPVGFAEGGHSRPIDLGGTPPISSIDAMRTGGRTDSAEMQVDEKTIRQLSDEIDFREAQSLKAMIENAIASNAVLAEFEDHIRIEIIREGVQVQIVDKSGEPMFPVGSDRLRNFSEDLIIELGVTLSGVRNKVTITGHTDSLPFPADPDYGNWELSSDRAHAARRALMMGGVSENRISRVVGLADTVPFSGAEDDPMNRRIALVILHEKAEPKADEVLIDLTGEDPEESSERRDWVERAKLNQPLPGENLVW